MSAAIEQLRAAIVQAERRGQRVIGYRPLTGAPKHPDGTLILSIETAPIGRKRAAPAPEPEQMISRGVRAGARAPQGRLL